MQHPVTKRWHCDACGSPYQQKPHLEKHQETCKRYQSELAERTKAAQAAEAPKPDVAFNQAAAEAYEKRKAARAAEEAAGENEGEAAGEAHAESQDDDPAPKGRKKKG